MILILILILILIVIIQIHALFVITPLHAHSYGPGD